MSWFALALLGALAQATYSYSVKVLLRRASPYMLAGSSFLTGSLVLFLIVIFTGVPALGPGLLPAAAITVTINIIATILFYRALSTTDLSLCVPMLAFTPVFLILTSFLILGELPSAAGAAGILLVSAGAYLLALEYRDDRLASLTVPFRTLASDRGVQSMLVVAFLYSISVNYDKEVVTASGPVFASAFVLSLLGIAFLCIAGMDRLLQRRRERETPSDGTKPAGGDTGSTGSRSQVTSGPGSHRGTCPGNLDSTGTSSRPFPGTRETREIPHQEAAPLTARTIPVPLLYAAVGMMLVVEGIAINTAYTMAIVPYVITVKRLAIFFSVLFGWLLLHEGNIRSRVTGAAVMIAGAVVIGVWG